MIEINSAVHSTLRCAAGRASQRCAISLAAHARQMNVAIAGGGTHPFQKWSERKIYPTERFLSVSEKYGFLAKQFTVFGQHIHIGCASARRRDLPHSRIRSLRAALHRAGGVEPVLPGRRHGVRFLATLGGQRVPALGNDAVRARLGGLQPLLRSPCTTLGIVESMKDFYWDMRPKPEFGTVEIRVCDTPLTVDRAAQLAAYAQALARRLLVERVDWITPDLYLVHSYNRFQACRHGLEGTLIDPATRRSVSVGDDIRSTLRELASHASALDSTPALAALSAMVASGANDARWLREAYASSKTLPDVVRAQAARWMNR